MHYHVWGSHCAKFDDDNFNSCWGIAYKGQTHRLGLGYLSQSLLCKHKQENIKSTTFFSNYPVTSKMSGHPNQYIWDGTGPLKLQAKLVNYSTWPSLFTLIACLKLKISCHMPFQMPVVAYHNHATLSENLIWKSYSFITTHTSSISPWYNSCGWLSVNLKLKVDWALT